MKNLFSKSRVFAIVFAIVNLFFVGKSFGQLLLNQDLTTGTVGNSVTAAPISWSSNGSGNGTFVIANASPLIYSCYNSSGGNYLAVSKSTSGTSNVGQTLSGSSGSPSFAYYSFLLNLSSAPS